MDINDLINNFSVTNLKKFFRIKIHTFKLADENYGYLFEDNDHIKKNYNSIIKIGEAELTNSDDLLIISAKTIARLSNRTGKKKQFEIAKKILKEENNDAAIFVFYDNDGNFRFSFIRANFIGAKREFTSFKRYTYFVSREFTNKTFKIQIGNADFSSIDGIQKAFSIDAVTDEFYRKLQRWYFWAIDNVKFPDDAEQEPNGREDAIIRLITRLIFIWFMKVRNLIPDSLFDKDNIGKILKDFSAEESTYYKAILQNLFFATLNTKQEERKFRSEKRGAKGYNQDFGNPNVFRYQNLFSNPELLKNLFSEIPFLNGGLFECLDYKTKDKNERKYIDGFTETKGQQPKVPNFLFFNETKKVDISSYFGKANQTYEVEGLINLLNSYNFTIDENEPDDVEVALDPELLGSIFENLLSSYNPETATTARKATGSFYTPREIVNYMTNESLKQYFMTNLIKNSPPFKEEYPKGEVVKKAKQISNLPQLKTFRKELRNNATAAEATLWTMLKDKKLDGRKFRRQHSIGRYILDFYCPEERLAVELDGEGHFQHSKAEYDAERDLFLNHYGIKVLRFENKLVWQNNEGLLQQIRDEFGWFDRETVADASGNTGVAGKSTTPSGKAGHPSLKGGDSYESMISKLIEENNYENPFDEETTEKLIDLIYNLRVVDPAVGSGAFPMAMLNKLVFILGKLDPENKFWKQSQIDGVKNSVSDSVLQRKLIEQIERQFKEKNADYGRKLYLIEKCIYGVDIQQIAVEIAKLRFFISLLVDEKIDFDNPENNYGIEPLPNLDFKLMQGNSLISTYAGIDFEEKNYDSIINEKNDELKYLKRKHKEIESEFIKIHNKEKRQDKNLKTKIYELDKKVKTIEKEIKKLKTAKNKDTDVPYKELIKEFEELKHQYQNEADNETKRKLREKIDKVIIKIFEEKISEHIPQLKNIEEKYSAIRSKEQREKYIAAEKQKLTKNLGFDIEQIEKELTTYNEGRKAKDFFLWNVYFAEVFTEKGGFDIVIGNPPYIQLQKAFDETKKYGDLYEKPGFETFERTGDIYALFYEKGMEILHPNGFLTYITSNKWMRANYGKSLRRFFCKKNPLLLLDLGPGIFSSATVDTNILLIQNKQTPKIKLKAVTLNKPIDELKQEDFVTLSNLSEESWIILSPQEQKIKERIEQIGTPLKDWDINIYRGVLTGYNEAFIIDGKTKDALIAQDPKSAEIIKPILRGRDIKRYKAEFADLWLINTHNGYKDENRNYVPPIDINNYPAIKTHLDQYWGKLKKRQDKGVTPYNLRNCAYLQEFEKEKIVYQEIVRYSQFYYDKQKFYPEATTFILTGKSLKYLVSLLNSKPVEYFFKTFYAGGGLGESGFRYKKAFLINLRIPQIPTSQQKPFEILVDYILFLKSQGEEEKSRYFEQIIDGMVYELYFEEEFKKAGCEMIKHLGNLPELTEEMSDEEKQRITNKMFVTLYDKNHPVRKNLGRIKRDVEEVRIIEKNTKIGS